MKNLKLLCLMMFSLSLVTFTSCNKDDDDDNQTVTPTNPLPSFDDADGVLAAVQVITFVEIPIVGGTQTIFTDAATGGFFDPNNTDAYLNGGAIMVNGKDIKKLDNNSYIFPNQDNPSETELDFSTSSGVEWEVAGSSEVTGFAYTTTSAMPGEMEFDGDYSTGTAGDPLTVNIMSSPGADKILWILSVGNEYIEKETSGNATAVTFTAAETEDLSGTGILQVVAVNFESSSASGKKIYFVNERVLNQFIEF